MATLAPTRPAMRQNPYVGPRTFRTEEASLFFGRDREARDLTSLIVSQRLTLFYAPSGAGKSSLLNTKVIPNLTGNEGFEVLPVARVAGSAPTELANNVFVYNLITSLHQVKETSVGFLNMSLSHFLDNLVQDNRTYQYNEDYTYPPEAVFKPRVLIIDQFEEILTTNTAYWSQRDDFFRQLSAVLQDDDLLWVVLAMREDFIAGLDPYLHHLPNRLAHRYYMQRLRWEAALNAIKQPAAHAGRPFAQGAAEILVDNLRQIDSENEQAPPTFSEFVEPVQLQAVCFQMWKKLQQSPGPTITREDVQNFADVDTALVNFYEDTISAVVSKTGVAEPELRNWFENELITEVGTRNMVFRGAETAGTMPTPVADAVRSHFILRQVVRAGGIWFELIHDRLVQPILDANQNWRLDQPLIRLAEQWKDAGRPDERLLEGRALENLLQTNWRALGSIVAEFIAASQKAGERAKAIEAAEKEAARQRELEQQRALAEEQSRRAEEQQQRAIEATRATRRQRILTIIASAMLLFFVIATIAAFAFAVNSVQTANALATQSAGLATESSRSQANADQAIRQRLTAEAAVGLYGGNLETQAAVINALLSATPTPTTEPTTPTPTPTAGNVISGDETPKPPTPTATSTPDLAATATANILQEQLDNIRATQTAVAAGPTELQTGMNINPDAHGTDPNTFLGLDWVRFPFKAAAKSRNLTAAFAEYDPIVKAFAENGIAVLFVLNQETYWGNAPWQNGDWESYAAQFGTTAGAIADHYAIYGNLVAFEIWNEPDASLSNPSALGISAGNYALVLKSAAEAISLAAPRSPFLFGSISGDPTTGIRYIASVEEAFGQALPVAAIGLHPYGSWGTFDPVYNEQFSNLSQVFNTYNNAFPDIPLWVTEIGVADNNPIDPSFYPDIAAYMLDVFQFINNRHVQKVPVVIWFAWSDLMRNAGITTVSGQLKPYIGDAYQDIRSGAAFMPQAAAQ